MNENYHEALEAAGHKLIRHEDGEVDIFAMDQDNCNGPGCEICGKSWCHHCNGAIEPCRGKQP